MITRRTRLLLALLALAAFGLRWLARPAVPYNWDVVQYALGMGEYSLALHQPHPPGSFFTVLLARAANAFLRDPHASLLLVSALASALTVPALFFLGRAGAHAVGSAGEAAGWWAAALGTTAPLFWFYGSVGLPYAADGLSATLTGLYALRLWQGRSDWNTALGAGLALGLAGGFRPTSLWFLGPLVLVGWVGLARCRPRAALLSAAAFALATLAWLVPTLISTDGPGRFLRLTRDLDFVLRSTAVWNSSDPLALLNWTAGLHRRVLESTLGIAWALGALGVGRRGERELGPGTGPPPAPSPQGGGGASRGTGYRDAEAVARSCPRTRSRTRHHPLPSVEGPHPAPHPCTRPGAKHHLLPAGRGHDPAASFRIPVPGRARGTTPSPVGRGQGVGRPDDPTHTSTRPHVLFYFLWIAPAALFCLLVHFGAPGYTLVYAPAIVALAAALLGRWTERWAAWQRAALMSGVMAANGFLFWFGVSGATPRVAGHAALSRAEIAHHDRYWLALRDHLGRHYPPGSVRILCSGILTDGLKVAQAVLPEHDRELRTVFDRHSEHLPASLMALRRGRFVSPAEALDTPLPVLLVWRTLGDRTHHALTLGDRLSEFRTVRMEHGFLVGYRSGGRVDG